MREKREGGFALVLAILTLMLLTFLGLTLTLTTSTEMQIAANYRWSQQAFFNAEAGLEAAKSILAAVDWATVLPCPRGTATDANGNLCKEPVLKWDPNGFKFGTSGGYYHPNSPYGATDGATRDWENASCDAFGWGQGFGAVLSTGGPAYENVTSLFPATKLQGGATIWIRRLVKANGDGTYSDDTSNEDAILTVEGTAPRPNLAGQPPPAGNALSLMELTISRTPTGVTRCGTSRMGQTGMGPEGANFGGCKPITDTGIAEGLAAATGGALGAGVTGTSVK